jgi:hypothetical protein
MCLYDRMMVLCGGGMSQIAAGYGDRGRAGNYPWAATLHANPKKTAKTRLTITMVASSG